jgi:glycosyltransferase involved in cell wall biosynthesis
VFAHPAENEPYGMVLLEAAIVGLPLIATQETGAVGPTAIARPGVNAVVYRAGDVEALGLHLARLRDDPVLREAMARESLLLSQDHHGEKSVAAVLAAAGLDKATSRDLPKG